MKECSGCGMVRPLGKFQDNEYQPDGKNSCCNKCLEIPDSLNEKRCSQCKKYRALDQYHKCVNTKDGLQTKCKSCQKKNDRGREQIKREKGMFIPVAKAPIRAPIVGGLNPSHKAETLFDGNIYVQQCFPGMKGVSFADPAPPAKRKRGRPKKEKTKMCLKCAKVLTKEYFENEEWICSGCRDMPLVAFGT